MGDLSKAAENQSDGLSARLTRLANAKPRLLHDVLPRDRASNSDDATATARVVSKLVYVCRFILCGGNVRIIRAKVVFAFVRREWVSKVVLRSQRFVRPLPSTVVLEIFSQESLIGLTRRSRGPRAAKGSRVL